MKDYLVLAEHSNLMLRSGTHETNVENIEDTLSSMWVRLSCNVGN